MPSDFFFCVIFLIVSFLNVLVGQFFVIWKIDEKNGRVVVKTLSSQ